MPTYEYRCNDCAHEFEAIQSMMDDPLSDCPSCGGLVQRLISRNVGIQFKGSGFYINDAAGKSSNSAAPSKNDTKKTTDSPPTSGEKPAKKPKKTGSKNSKTKN